MKHSLELKNPDGRFPAKEPIGKSGVRFLANNFQTNHLMTKTGPDSESLDSFAFIVTLGSLIASSFIYIVRGPLILGCDLVVAPYFR